MPVAGRSFQAKWDGYAAVGWYSHRQGINAQQENSPSKGQNKRAHSQEAQGITARVTRHAKSRKYNNRHEDHDYHYDRTFFGQIAHYHSLHVYHSHILNIIIFKLQSKALTLDRVAKSPFAAVCSSESEKRHFRFPY